MKRVTLIYNPGAGDAEHAGDDLLEALASAGYEARLKSTKDDSYRKALENPGELVVVAGGDGTVRKAAKQLIGKKVPLAVLPLGTANNIATSLGITWGAREMVEGLATARRVRFDAGLAKGPWGEKYFFESFGLGLFTDVMTALDARKEREPATFERADDPLALAVRALREALRGYPTRDLRPTLDGEDLSGRHLMIEAMNISLTGPNLLLAPDADPGDGLLDFVLITEDRREEFDEYLEYRLEGKQAAPGLLVLRGRRLEFTWDGSLIRFDDEAWPEEAWMGRGVVRSTVGGGRQSELAMIEVTLAHGGLEFLTPAAVRSSG